MELALLIYLAGVAAQVKTGAVLSLVGVISMYIIYLAVKCASDSELEYKKMFSFTVIFLSSLLIFTPDKETIYMMAAGYTGQKVVENIGSSEAFGKVQVILNNKLDEIITEQQKKLSK